LIVSHFSSGVMAFGGGVAMDDGALWIFSSDR